MPEQKVNSGTTIMRSLQRLKVAKQRHIASGCRRWWQELKFDSPAPLRTVEPIVRLRKLECVHVAGSVVGMLNDYL